MECNGINWYVKKQPKFIAKNLHFPLFCDIINATTTMVLQELSMKVLKLIPGVILSVGIAALACFIESLLPIHLIGSAVIAMFIGMGAAMLFEAVLPADIVNFVWR